MRKILLIVTSIILIASLALFCRFSPKGITGFATTGNTTVGIGQRIKGEITALLYKEYINFSDIQDITVEFTNIGSVTVTSNIQVKIYWNNQSKLQEIANYYDSGALLSPSMRRTYHTSFLPPYPGLYYIQAKVPYDGRMVEKWASFMVYYTPPPPPPPETTIPRAPYPRPPPTPESEEIVLPQMSLEYPEIVKIMQGESKIFSVLARNIGNASMTNIRFYISTTNLVTIEINPKSVFKLSSKESAIFLITVDVPNKTTAGKYPFDFVVVSDQIKDERSIQLEILSVLPLIEDLYETILNYEYIISEIQNEIDAAALKDIDVKIPQDTLDKAKISLELAKGYYQQGKYEDAKTKLMEVKEYLEDAVYQLAVVGIKIYVPAFMPITILIIVFVPLMLLILLIFLKRKKEKEKRPKLLGAISETES